MREPSQVEEAKPQPKYWFEIVAQDWFDDQPIRSDFVIINRYKESPKLFHHGEGSGISHHWNDQLVHQPQVSQHSTMPTFFAVGNEGFQGKESLEDYFMEYESQT